eukprot:scaffold5770_cov388-Prasinococcus_capsulatus_cf.AAC.12
MAADACGAPALKLSEQQLTRVRAARECGGVILCDKLRQLGRGGGGASVERPADERVCPRVGSAVPTGRLPTATWGRTTGSRRCGPANDQHMPLQARSTTPTQMRPRLRARRTETAPSLPRGRWCGGAEALGRRVCGPVLPGHPDGD